MAGRWPGAVRRANDGVQPNGVTTSKPSLRSSRSALGEIVMASPTPWDESGTVTKSPAHACDGQMSTWFRPGTPSTAVQALNFSSKRKSRKTLSSAALVKATSPRGADAPTPQTKRHAWDAWRTRTNKPPWAAASSSARQSQSQLTHGDAAPAAWYQ